MSRRTKLYRRCIGQSETETAQNIIAKHARCKHRISDKKAVRIAHQLHVKKAVR